MGVFVPVAGIGGAEPLGRVPHAGLGGRIPAVLGTVAPAVDEAAQVEGEILHMAVGDLGKGGSVGNGWETVLTAIAI